jgi:hypothetical protein
VLFLLAVPLTTFAIKITAPLYFVPVLLGLSVAWLLRRDRSLVPLLAACLPALAAIGILTYITRDIWRHFLHFDGLRILSGTLLNPLTLSQPLWATLGLVCACHILLTKPRTFLESPYRASLFFIVLAGPVLLAVFIYSPLRYYLPLVPAYLLLPLEWLHLRAWKWQVLRQTSWPIAMLCLPVLIWTVFSFFETLNLYVLFNIPIPLGLQPGLEDESMFSYATPVAVVVAIALWRFRGWLFTPTRTLAAVCLLALLGLSWDLWMIGRFWTAPSYQAREISRAIERAAPDAAVVAGDWAPFLTLGTSLEPHRMFNFSKPEALPAAQERLLSAHPDYFLWNEMMSELRPYRGQPRWLIEVTPGISLGRPILQSTYAGSRITLYPLSYGPEQPPG